MSGIVVCTVQAKCCCKRGAGVEGCPGVYYGGGCFVLQIVVGALQAKLCCMQVGRGKGCNYMCYMFFGALQGR